MRPIPVIFARTHPPEYLLHKYWSRKPHNVLAHFLSELLPRPGTVVDPFCGSGVLLREAARLGHRAFGFDLNPAAALIARVTIFPPDSAAFREAVEPAFAGLDRLCDRAYGATDGTARVKYAVHQTVVRCPGCDREIASRSARKQGRRYSCPDCGRPLRFNLANLVRTEVEGVAIQGRPGLRRDPGTCDFQRDAARRPAAANESFSDVELAPNKRILAFSGMRISDLFTPRNFSLMAAFTAEISNIEIPELREAARLLLTASVAQCSRLIPCRDNLTTGGPAWSVPGFWVPPVHLETNPAVHLRARLEKLCRGFDRLRASPIPGRAAVEESDACCGLRALARKGVEADLVFLDPPYGDSVPYLEFSALWNAFLARTPDLDADLSVSDRESAADPWTRYRAGLDKVMSAVNDVLAPHGNLLITFNNHDLRAWEALLGALQRHSFACCHVAYQLPAVVPAKACFSPRNSYTGDIYAVFRRAEPSFEPADSLDPVIRALRTCASARGGRVARNLAFRTMATAWMQHHITAHLLSDRDHLLTTLFTTDGPNTLRWRGPLDPAVPPLEQPYR